MGLFSSSVEVFDVTVPFSSHVPTWPSHPPSRVEPLSRIADGAGSNVSMLEITSHAGTHVDANWHFVDNGARLLEIPLQRWNGPCYDLICLPLKLAIGDGAPTHVLLARPS